MCGGCAERRLKSENRAASTSLQSSRPIAASTTVVGALATPTRSLSRTPLMGVRVIAETTPTSSSTINSETTIGGSTPSRGSRARRLVLRSPSCLVCNHAASHVSLEACQKTLRLNDDDCRCRLFAIMRSTRWCDRWRAQSSTSVVKRPSPTAIHFTRCLKSQQTPPPSQQRVSSRPTRQQHRRHLRRKREPECVHIFPTKHTQLSQIVKRLRQRHQPLHPQMHRRVARRLARRHFHAGENERSSVRSNNQSSRRSRLEA